MSAADALDAAMADAADRNRSTASTDNAWLALQVQMLAARVETLTEELGRLRRRVLDSGRWEACS